MRMRDKEACRSTGLKSALSRSASFRLFSRCDTRYTLSSFQSFSKRLFSRLIPRGGLAQAAISSEIFAVFIVVSSDRMKAERIRDHTYPLDLNQGLRGSVKIH